MSNQRITGLNRLSKTEITDADLLVVADVSSIASPTGETKNLTIGDLGEYFVPTNEHVFGTIYQNTHSFVVGNILRIDQTTKAFTLALCDTDENSEVVGIVKNVIDVDNFELAYQGVVDFGNSNIFNISPLKQGTVYYLSNVSGALQDSDPSLLNDSFISKPYMVGLTDTRAIITNYRGFYRSNSDEFTVTTLTVSQSNNFVVGDVVRKTLTTETSSLGDWILADSNNEQNCNFVGIVTERSQNYFKITTTGVIKNLNNINIGQVYYLTTTSSFNSLTSSTRNLTTSKSNLEYIKPVYIGVSQNSAVLINQLTTKTQQNLVGSSGQVYGPFTYVSNTRPVTSNLINLLNNLVSSPVVNDGAIVYWMSDFEVSSGKTGLIVIYSFEYSTTGWIIYNESEHYSEIVGTETTGSANNFVTQEEVQNYVDPQFSTLTSQVNSLTKTTQQLSSFKNKVINGDFRIWQRGSSFNSLENGSYFSDRFLFGNGTSGAVSVSQQQDTPSNQVFEYSSKFVVGNNQSTLSNSMFTNFSQKFEGFNVRDLYQNTFAISFWVKSNLTGTYCISITNGSSNYSFVSEYTIRTVNTWEKKIIVIPNGLTQMTTYDWSNGTAMQVSWTLSSGTTYQTSQNSWIPGNFIATSNQVNWMASTNNTFYITGIQLEVGSTATNFETRPIGIELDLCKRYYQQFFAYFRAQVVGTTFFPIIYPKSVRTNPAITLSSDTVYSNGNGATIYNAGTDTCELSYNATSVGGGSSYVGTSLLINAEL
jgi:hypothetical protein